MQNVSDLAAKGQDFVNKTVESVLDTVREAADLVPTPSEVFEQITATANELLTLSQDVQNKVLSALKDNA
ncbi:MAG TPA: hypothetical protein VLI04_07685 [Nocardioidaceae bacterium]|nr:hypothetical protein [Nocardioidaceae bacterium]